MANTKDILIGLIIGIIIGLIISTLLTQNTAPKPPEATNPETGGVSDSKANPSTGQCCMAAKGLCTPKPTAGCNSQPEVACNSPICNDKLA